MLSVSEEDGRFILYRRNDKADKWKPLVFEDFPSTTYFKFFDKSSKVLDFGLGGKNNYSETKIIDDTIVYFWKNQEIKIKIVYKLVPSVAGGSSDTLLIDLSLINLTDKIININYYFCVDTYLGEKLNKHFLIPGGVVVDSEKEIPKNGIPGIITSFDNDLKLGVNILLNKEKQITPDRVFFANWKKVEQENALYKVDTGKSFDLKPYSINDSALFIEYNDCVLKANNDLTYRFILSVNSDVIAIEDKKEVVKEEVVKIDSAKDKTISDNSDDKKDSSKLINLSLSELLKLLDKINKKLTSGEKLEESDVELSKQILSEIKKRKGKK